VSVAFGWHALKIMAPISAISDRGIFEIFVTIGFLPFCIGKLV